MVDKKLDTGELLPEMMASKNQDTPSALVIEADAGAPAEEFAAQLSKTLAETESEVIAATGKNSEGGVESWHRARVIVEQFKPAPWFIWRLSNFVFSNSAQVGVLPQGFMLGLRRLLFAAASDSILGVGGKVNNVHKALKILRAEVIGAISVIHSISRKLQGGQHERIWRPILDDAILRAQIGYILGSSAASFDPGRMMLAGFAGRCGLAIQISTGSLEQAHKSLDLLSKGEELRRVGLKVYQAEPLQVSAMVLTAAGCGRDAAFGTVNFAVRTNSEGLEPTQLKWLAAFSVVEYLREGKIGKISEEFWHTLGFNDKDVRNELNEQIKKMVRKGHEWGWLL